MSVFSRWSFSSLSAQFSLDAATRVILRWPISFARPYAADHHTQYRQYRRAEAS
jgi:hypothetical protein